MASVPGLRGMRHIALRVRDIGRAKAFYRENFGMDVVWEPDSENVYLSSGTDNLALHATHESAAPPERQQLDHLGFVVGSAADETKTEEHTAELHSRPQLPS